MYQGTYARNPRKPKRRAVRMNKTAILLLAVILLAGAVIGTTVAYLTTKTNAIENVFTYAQVSCAVDEKFDGTTKSDVCIKNTSNIDAYIRATYVANWVDSTGKIVASVPSGYSYDLVYPTTGDWIYNSTDGYYYYKEAVAPNGFTDGSFVGYTVHYPDPANHEYTLQVEIIASAIQSQPTSAVQQAWGVTYPLSGN